MVYAHNKQVRVAVLDDHPMVRTVFELCLKHEPDIQLVGAWSSSNELFNQLRSTAVDVLVLDFLLGERELDGLALVKQLRNHYPQQKILISSSMESPAIVKMVLSAGVKGFIGKSHNMQEIVQAIRQVAQGRLFLSQEVAYEVENLYVMSEDAINDNLDLSSKGNMYEKVKTLSPREVEVVRCFLDGLSVSQIAVKFKRSRKTVSGQKQSALKKLGLRSDSELFKYSHDLMSGN
ncbi:DNA-binding response regulator [Pantoea wallisii]|uniref:DNA-binding response regulator n=1 Tax=Pantoea wallisii TaxID=1076551 RepID=A0A1X1D2S7_9GAMM|nr:response regulator transcription factor [Pantoea wallisii]ORM70934.1 DNA-binding response regulator [Pantoea wallisii]